MSSDRPPDRRPEHNDILEHEVQQAAAALGWTVPQTEDEVRQAESELTKHPTDLPEAMRDLGSALERAEQRQSSVPHPLPLPGDPTIEQNLARAAREGGPIPPEIEARLRRDREAAERELDDGPEDP